MTYNALYFLTHFVDLIHCLCSVYSIDGNHTYDTCNLLSLTHHSFRHDILPKANFPDDGNWQTEAYNRGVRAGAQQVIDKYEKQCLEDSPDECNDLGVAAAQGNHTEFTSHSFHGIGVLIILL